MSTNLLDANQVIKQVYDPATESLKTTPSGATTFSVELDAADGDSVSSFAASLSDSATITPSSTGTVIAEQTCVGFNLAKLYAKSLAILSQQAVFRLDVSPSDSEDIWFQTSTTLTASASANAVVASSDATIIARRIRVVLTTAPVGGNVDLYLVASA